MHWLSRVCQFKVALALGLVVVGLISAGAGLASTTRWGVEPSPSVHGRNVLNGVAATSAKNAWAVGSYGLSRTLIEHRNGRGWRVQPSPSPSSWSELLGVAAISSANAWAVGDRNLNASRTLVEHWNGRAWKVQASPNPGQGRSKYGGGLNNELLGVAAVSSTNAWAVGDRENGDANPRTLVEHWNGRAWKVQPSPNLGGPGIENWLSGVAATSPTNAWAVGATYNERTGTGRALIEHWDGKVWEVQPGASLSSDAGLVDLAATSATNAWAVGYDSNSTLVEHWDGKAWTVQLSPNIGKSPGLSDVAATSTTNAWAVGRYRNRGVPQTLVEHWDGKAWTVQPSPNPGHRNALHSVAATSTTDAWAVGARDFRCDYCGKTLVEHWNGKG